MSRSSSRSSWRPGARDGFVVVQPPESAGVVLRDKGAAAHAPHFFALKEGQPSRLALKRIPHGRARQSPEGPSIHVSSLWIEGSSVDPIGGRNSRRLCRRIEAALSRFWTRVDREIVVVAGASSDQQLLRVLASVKARRCAPPPLRGAHGLDAGSVRIPDEVERRFRTKWEHRFRRKWNIDSGKWNTDSGKWNVDSGRSGTSAPGIVNARR